MEIDCLSMKLYKLWCISTTK